MSRDAPEEDAPRPAEGEDNGEAEALPEASPASDEADAEAQRARRKRKKKRAEAARAAPSEVEPDDDDDEPPPRPRRLSVRDQGGLVPWFIASLSTDRRPEQSGDTIPAFALGFPEDPALQALVAAFEQGDYARVRREAPALVQQTDSAEVRKAARELVKRLDPDPIAVYLLAGAAVLLAFLALWYWTHPHAAP